MTLSSRPLNAGQILIDSAQPIDRIVQRSQHLRGDHLLLADGRLCGPDLVGHIIGLRRILCTVTKQSILRGQLLIGALAKLEDLIEFGRRL